MQLLYSFNPVTELMELIRLIQNQQQTKKNLAIQDVYKLLYQGVLGNQHILKNIVQAKEYLKQEVMMITPSDDESLIEEISVNGEMVRLNLRPYKYRNGDLELLFQAMLDSARSGAGSKKEFIQLWDSFKRAVYAKKLNFDLPELINFDTKLKAENYPAIHHSFGYREANQPAYRVLKREFAEKVLSE